jgi:DNA-binding response OmpR family regulator
MGALAHDVYPLACPQPRILVVDDDNAIRVLLTTVLKRNGFAVDVARNGDEAVEMVVQRSYAVILLDLMMPRLDGIEVIEYLDRSAAGLSAHCVIVLTAAAGRDLARLDGRRVFRVLRKPFDLSELIAEVSECVETQANGTSKTGA